MADWLLGIVTQIALNPAGSPVSRSSELEDEVYDVLRGSMDCVGAMSFDA